MASETTTTETFEIMPPTWSAILPVMLEARANIRRQLDAPACDGWEDGWCSVHNQPFDRPKSKGCDHFTLTTEERHKWRAELLSALRSNDELFQQMAAVADRAVEARKALGGK